jgi:hypothetical protein
MLTKAERNYTSVSITYYIRLLKDLIKGYKHGIKEGYYDESYLKLIAQTEAEIEILESAWKKIRLLEVVK